MITEEIIKGLKREIEEDKIQIQKMNLFILNIKKI